jgi:hypothetical protein
MISNLDSNLRSIALGIRFRANFSIEDQLGKIVDQILYSEKAYFNSKRFPMVQSEVTRKTLFNRNTGNKITIDNSNIIVEIVFDEDFKVTDLDSMHRHFKDDIVNGFLRDFKIREIVRIGYIRSYIFPLKELATNFVNKTVGQTLGGINDISLHFSKKLPLEKSLMKKDINDYHNVIFNVVKKADLEEIFMSIDYQHYYDPFLTTASEIEYNSFIACAESFNNTKYLTWLNNNYIEVK